MNSIDNDSNGSINQSYGREAQTVMTGVPYPTLSMTKPAAPSNNTNFFMFM